MKINIKINQINGINSSQKLFQKEFIQGLRQQILESFPNPSIHFSSKTLNSSGSTINTNHSIQNPKPLGQEIGKVISSKIK